MQLMNYQSLFFITFIGKISLLSISGISFYSIYKSAKTVIRSKIFKEIQWLVAKFALFSISTLLFIKYEFFSTIYKGY